MKPNIRRCAMVLIALAAINLSGCFGKDAVTPEELAAGAFEDIREQVRLTIGDPNRQSTVLAIVDDLQVDYANLRGEIIARRDSFRALNADYDATREQFENLFEQHAARVKSRHDELRTTRSAFIAATTTDEWDAMAKATTKSMAALARSLRSI